MIGNSDAQFRLQNRNRFQNDSSLNWNRNWNQTFQRRPHFEQPYWNRNRNQNIAVILHYWLVSPFDWDSSAFIFAMLSPILHASLTYRRKQTVNYNKFKATLSIFYGQRVLRCKGIMPSDERKNTVGVVHNVGLTNPDRRTNRQCPILCLARFTEHFARQSSKQVDLPSYWEFLF